MAGFMDDMLKIAGMSAAIQDSKKANKGKPDAGKIAGTAFGLGYTSLNDMGMLGSLLNAEGAFDDENKQK